jgi:hypothetical protein
MYLEYLELEIIADTLADLDNFFVDDLRSVFISTLTLNEVNLHVEQMNRLYNAFMCLDPKERNSPAFNYRKFVEQNLSAAA